MILKIKSKKKFGTPKFCFKTIFFQLFLIFHKGMLTFYYDQQTIRYFFKYPLWPISRNKISYLWAVFRIRIGFMRIRIQPKISMQTRGQNRDWCVQLAYYYLYSFKLYSTKFKLVLYWTPKSKYSKMKYSHCLIIFELNYL